MSDEGRVALVTGGVQGLGAASAKALAACGFKVVAGHLGGGERAREFHEETEIPVYEWDVSDVDACSEHVDQIRSEIGEIEVLVNNAGVNVDKMFHKMSREDWDAVIDVDLGSMFNMTRKLIEGMREREYGRVINISSVNGQKGQAGQANYCAAKAGVLGFTRALALEGASKGITVNAIAPGYAQTPMVDKVPGKIMEDIIADIPIGRLAQPEEIARCVVFLAAEEADYITGATICANGGFYIS